MEKYNDQEQFWSGDFGDGYIERNGDISFILPKYITQWATMLRCMRPSPLSAIEFGCNVGLNLMALHALCPEMDREAVEINQKASQVAAQTGAVVHNLSLLDFTPVRKYELSFTCGVLIHIAPQDLPRAYDVLYRTSSRYILVNEYYNPCPVEVTYRGHAGKLFKRDFAGEMLDRYHDLRLCDYGFFYHRDTLASVDDMMWFVMEKTGEGSARKE